MKRLKLKTDLDKIGITTSVLCAIHCAFLPILITTLSLLGIGFLVKGWTESLMVLLSILIAGISIATSYKAHRSFLPLVLLIIGLVIIAAVHLFLPENPEPFILPVGGITIATAHYFNWNYNRRCTINYLHLKQFNKVSK